MLRPDSEILGDYVISIVTDASFVLLDYKMSILPCSDPRVVNVFTIKADCCILAKHEQKIWKYIQMH